MLIKNDYRSLDRVFSFVAAFIDRGARHERTASVTKIHAIYIVILCDVTGGKRQRASTEEVMEMLYERVKTFKRMLVVTFHELGDSGFYTFKYRLLDHMMNDLLKFGTLSVLDRNLYEHFNVHNKAFL